MPPRPSSAPGTVTSPARGPCRRPCCDGQHPSPRACPERPRRGSAGETRLGGRASGSLARPLRSTWTPPSSTLPVRPPSPVPGGHTLLRARARQLRHRPDPTASPRTETETRRAGRSPGSTWHNPAEWGPARLCHVKRSQRRHPLPGPGWTPPARNVSPAALAAPPRPLARVRNQLAAPGDGARLPEKGGVRRGSLKGANVRKRQGCTPGGDGPPRPAGSPETMAAAVAVMAMAGLLPTGLRLLWRPPTEEGQGAQRGHAQCHRGHVVFMMQHTSTQTTRGANLLPGNPVPRATVPHTNATRPPNVSGAQSTHSAVRCPVSPTLAVTGDT